MASKRALLTFTLRSPSTILRSQLSLVPRAIAPAPRAVQVPLCRQVQQTRWHSAPSGIEKSKAYEFEDIKRLVESPDMDVILIDVREPSEYASGSIPTALNIPITSQPDALLLPPDEFEDRFGFQKPPPATEVVFYCKAGVRSAAAAQLARQGGYEKVGEYKGSWMDWESRGGAGSKDPSPGGKPGGAGENTV